MAFCKLRDFKEVNDWTLHVRTSGKAEHISPLLGADGDAPKRAPVASVKGHGYALWLSPKLRKYAGQEVEVTIKVAAAQKVRLVVAKDIPTRKDV